MVSTHLKNISQIGSFPQVGVKIKKYLTPPTSQFLIRWPNFFFWINWYILPGFQPKKSNQESHDNWVCFLGENYTTKKKNRKPRFCGVVPKVVNQISTFNNQLEKQILPGHQGHQQFSNKKQFTNFWVGSFFFAKKNNDPFLVS